MTDRQRKILIDAFLLLAGGARTGKRKAETGTAGEVLEHVSEIEGMISELKQALAQHIGADAILSKVRAKPLSSSRRS